MKLWFTPMEHDCHPSLIFNEAVTKKANEVILLGESEWEPLFSKEIIEKFKFNNIQLNIVYGGYFDSFYENYIKEVELNRENIFNWHTFWLNWSFYNLRYKEWKSDKPFPSKPFPNNSDIDTNHFIYPFISLNKRNHYHRCVFIDEMAKQQLIESGVVTWIKNPDDSQYFQDYPYQYFDNRQILLNDNFVKNLDHYVLPREFYQSLFHVIIETTTKCIFLTEKTATPLFMKKPFFVLAAPGFSGYLTNVLGFKLYDEVIDYSYDDIEDLHLRTEKFVENIHKFKNLNLKKTYELLKPKIDYNYNRALEIVHDIKYIPEIIQERCKESFNSLDKFSNDGVYIHFVNKCKNNIR